MIPNLVGVGMKQMFVFDGDCAFCSSSMRLLRKLTKDRIPAKPFQFLNLEQFGLTLDQTQSAVQYVTEQKTFRGAEAIAHFLMDSKTGWAAAGWLMRAPVLLSFFEIIYSVVAANRHRLPGGTPECKLGAS